MPEKIQFEDIDAWQKAHELTLKNKELRLSN
jgi:hypothetical protein